MEKCKRVIDCLDQANLMTMYRTLSDSLYYEKCGWSCLNINCNECIFNRKGKKCSEDQPFTFKDWVQFGLMDIGTAIEIFELDEKVVSEMMKRAYEIKDN